MPKPTLRNSNSLNDSEKKVIRYLARFPNQTPYKVEKATNLAHSTVDRVFRQKGAFVKGISYGESNLVSRQLVDIISKEKFRETGTERKEYALSFKGLMVYFSSILSEYWFKDGAKIDEVRKNYLKEMDDVIRNYEDKHVIFSRWDELNQSIIFGKNVGGGLHGILPIICNDTYHQHFALTWRLEDFSSFNKKYPLSSLGLEGYFSFAFLGWLAGDYELGWLKVTKPIDGLFKEFETIKKSLNEISTSIEKFSINFSPPC